MIGQFVGKYAFLDNDFDIPVKIDGNTYRNATVAFEAMKIEDETIRFKFGKKTSAEAKRYTKSMKLPPEWDKEKESIMESVIIAKFKHNPQLKMKLLATGDETLVYTNNHNDKYWGIYKGQGQNRLGIILMKVRSMISKL